MCVNHLAVCGGEHCGDGDCGNNGGSDYGGGGGGHSGPTLITLMWLMVKSGWPRLMPSPVPTAKDAGNTRILEQN